VEGAVCSIKAKLTAACSKVVQIAQRVMQRALQAYIHPSEPSVRSLQLPPLPTFYAVSGGAALLRQCRHHCKLRRAKVSWLIVVVCRAVQGFDGLHSNAFSFLVASAG
jgi:hypothetical protein